METREVTFDFSEEYVFEDTRARISPLKVEHIPHLANVSNKAQIWVYFFEKAFYPDEMQAYVNRAISKRKNGVEYPFVIFDKRSKKFAGTTRLYEYQNNLKTIKLGHTWLGVEFQGTGLNQRCKFLLFEFIFEKLGLERIGFGVYASNQRSIAALKSVGCQVEGRLRNMFPSVKGLGRTDAILMSILKQEWVESKKTNLKNKRAI